MSPYNVGPAAPDESIVFGACRPEHPRKAPPDDSVNAWLAFMDDNDIERVCCLLDGEHLDEYPDLLDTYRTHFGTECICHAPIPDFRRVDKATLQETILPFLETADDSGERVVVHCSAGQGRTGHILALWLVYGRGYALDEAIAVVQQLGRSPLEAAIRSDLAALVGDPNEDSE